MEECGQLTGRRVINGNTLEESAVMIIFPLEHTPRINILKTYSKLNRTILLSQLQIWSCENKSYQNNKKQIEIF